MVKSITATVNGMQMANILHSIPASREDSSAKLRDGCLQEIGAGETRELRERCRPERRNPCPPSSGHSDQMTHTQRTTS